jgi:hypothetical protein
VSDQDPERKQRRLESVIPELIKRAVEIGVEKAQEAPDSLKQLVGDLRVPKEIAHYLLSQVEETKNGLFRVVAKEMRDFLEHANLAGEMQKLLTTVQFEINTTVRFRPNTGDPAAREGDSGDNAETRAPLSKPDVKTQVHIRRDEPRPRRRPKGEEG